MLIAQDVNILCFFSFVEINKDEANEEKKAIYSELAIAKESATITCLGKLKSRLRETFIAEKRECQTCLDWRLLAG